MEISASELSKTYQLQHQQQMKTEIEKLDGHYIQRSERANNFCMEVNGFIMHRENSRDNKHYWRCDMRRRFRCSARAATYGLLSESSKVIFTRITPVTQPWHNHLPDLERLANLKKAISESKVLGSLGGPSTRVRIDMRGGRTFSIRRRTPQLKKPGQTFPRSSTSTSAGAGSLVNRKKPRTAGSRSQSQLQQSSWDHLLPNSTSSSNLQVINCTSTDEPDSRLPMTGFSFGSMNPYSFPNNLSSLSHWMTPSSSETFDDEFNGSYDDHGSEDICDYNNYNEGNGNELKNVETFGSSGRSSLPLAQFKMELEEPLDDEELEFEDDDEDDMGSFQDGNGVDPSLFLGNQSQEDPENNIITAPSGPSSNHPDKGSSSGGGGTSGQQKSSTSTGAPPGSKSNGSKSYSSSDPQFPITMLNPTSPGSVSEDMSGIFPDGQIFGVVGGGEMAKAIVLPLIHLGLIDPNKIIVSAATSSSLEPWATLGCSVTTVNNTVFQRSNVIMWAVKPQIFPKVIEAVEKSPDEIKLKSRTLHISVMAGVSLKQFNKSLENVFSNPMTKISTIRVMPNIGIRVGTGCAVFAGSSSATEEDKNIVSEIFSQSGFCLEVEESKINAYCGLFGSGIGFMFPILEAMCDGAVKMGIPRETSLRLAAQTMKGASELILQENKHPGVLKDSVCSPGGTTIAGVAELERYGVRNAIISAVEAATKRGDELGRLAENALADP